MEEINLRLSRNLTALGIRVVLVYAAALPPELDRRMREGGAAIEVLPYGKDLYRFYRELGRILRTYSVSMAHVCFFDYFSLVPWLTRLQGLRCILYEELNSGMLNARSWKKRLLQVRTLITTLPMTRVIAVSEFVRRDLIERGISADRIVVRHLAADETRFTPDPGARQRWAAEYAIQSGELIMSTVTLLRPFKSPETLIEACAVLARRGVPARLFVAGDGAMLADLKQLSKRLGTDERIHWLGFCRDPTDSPASLGCIPAGISRRGRWVCLERSHGLRCAYCWQSQRCNTGVRRGWAHGLLATPKDPVSFADAIQKLAGDESLRRTR